MTGLSRNHLTLFRVISKVRFCRNKINKEGRGEEQSVGVHWLISNKNLGNFLYVLFLFAYTITLYRIFKAQNI